jgi:hypothetical protein
MNTAQEFLSFADSTAHLRNVGLKATISTFLYSQKVKEYARATARLSRSTPLTCERSTAEQRDAKKLNAHQLNVLAVALSEEGLRAPLC